jgi:predicted membrane protein
MPSIHSLLVALTYPLGLSTALLLVAILALVFGHRKSAASLAALAVCWSVLWSVPAVSDRLRQALEDRHPVVAEAALP